MIDEGSELDPGAGDIDVLIVEHLDPERAVPSGIDSVVAGMVAVSPPYRLGVIGVTSRAGGRATGRWHRVLWGDREILFFPVAVLDRSSHGVVSRLVPHSLRFIAALVVRRRALRPGTVVHAHRVETGAALSLLTRAPCVQFIHNDSSGLLGATSDSAWRHLPRLYRLLERRAVRTAAETVVFNAGDLARLRQLRTDVQRALTWFDPPVFSCNPTTRSGPLRILWVGRLESQKDPMLALRTSRVLKSRGVAHELVIAGDGALRTELLQATRAEGLADEIRLAGALPRPAVAEFMRTSDCLLLTSHYEGSPTVIAEAGASGLPVVATAAADPDRVLRRGVNGIRVSDRSPEGLASALTEARWYSRTACCRAAQERSLEKVAPQLVRLAQEAPGG